MNRQSGHIESLTDRVVEAAMKQPALRQRDDPQLSMNVNISGRDLARPSLVERVRSVLAGHPVSPGSLMLEITEQLKALREPGVDVAQGHRLARPMRAEQAMALIAVEDSAPA